MSTPDRRQEQQTQPKSRIVEIQGNIWDIGRVAKISSDVASSFLDRFSGFSETEKKLALMDFQKHIINTPRGLKRGIQLFTKNRLMSLMFEEDAPGCDVAFDDNTKEPQILALFP